MYCFRMRRWPNIRKGISHLDGRKKLEKGRFFASALTFLAKIVLPFVAKTLFGWEKNRKKKKKKNSILLRPNRPQKKTISKLWPKK